MNILPKLFALKVKIGFMANYFTRSGIQENSESRHIAGYTVFTGFSVGRYEMHSLPLHNFYPVIAGKCLHKRLDQIACVKTINSIFGELFYTLMFSTYTSIPPACLLIPRRTCNVCILRNLEY